MSPLNASPEAAGTCQIDNARAEKIKTELIGELISPRRAHRVS
jgi:hypothetical protein